MTYAPRSVVSHSFALVLGCSLGFVSVTATAAPRKARALRTWVRGPSDTCTTGGSRVEPVDAEGQALAKRIDALVADAIEDAGLELAQPSDGTEPGTPTCLDELAILEMAEQGQVIAPELIRRDNQLVLRLQSASPGSKILRVSTQEVSAAELDVRTVVLVSEILGTESQQGSSLSPTGTPTSAPPTERQLAPSTSRRTHSPGRGVLTLTSAFLGGAVGYSLQRASGSDDPRLTYPLIALGTGMGLGASMIAADEWDISVAEAWYLNAGMLWPTTSGLLLARAYQVSPTTDRYVYGLSGAATGLALSSFALSSSEITEGGAALAHSGGTIGLLMGGLVELTAEGNTDYLPWHGMGFGSAIGVLAAGAAATQVDVSSSRVVFIDTAAGLGALTGAAVGSPLLFVEGDLIPVKRQRAWLGIVGIGAIVGGGLGWYFTRGMPPEDDRQTAKVWPYATLVPDLSESAAVQKSQFSAGVQGIF